MLPIQPKSASSVRRESFLVVLCLAVASLGSLAPSVFGAGNTVALPQKEKSGAIHREKHPPQTAHHEQPDDPPMSRQPGARPQRPRLNPGERIVIEGIDGGVLVGLPDDVAPRSIRTGTAGGGGELVIYSNTNGSIAFQPGADRLIADDLAMNSIGSCSLLAYEILVSGGGDGSGSGFQVETALYDACPGEGGQIIAGTQHQFNPPDDGMFLLRRDFVLGGIEIPTAMWLGVRFSTDQAGWLVGTPPEIGFSQDLYHHPDFPCTADFDPTLHASFHARVIVSANCPQGEFVQVNVDANGLNMIGDAANEPSIAVDPNDPNRMAIGWRQFDTIESNFRQAGRGYSTDGGQSWTFPGVLDPGFFRSDPVLDFDAEGNFYYNSMRLGFSTRVFKSTDGGMTWEPPTFAFGGDKPWMAIDRTDGIGHGNIYQAWSAHTGCCGNASFNRSTDGGAVFETPTSIPFVPRWGTLSVGPDGELYIVGRASLTRTNNLAVVRSSNAQNPGAVPSFEQALLVDIGGAIRFGTGPNPDGLAGQPWVATDHSTGPPRGNVYVLASVDPPGPDPVDVMFTRSEDGGATWSPPIRINDDPADGNAWQWFGTMSVAPNGRIDVVWNDTRRLGNARLSELYYSFSLDQGETWSANKQLSPIFDSHIGWPNQSKIGDYYDMISHDQAAYLAFAATFNGEQDVYFLRITTDCNDNGIPDPTDIADGTSGDCDGNIIPDECQPDLDCNGNGIQDICDVAGPTGGDCNNNGIPDDCESQVDCNGNQIADLCDLAQGTSPDCNGNARPDECDVADGSAPDCNANTIPDACDLASGLNADCDANGIPDECDIADCNGDLACADCNADGIPDGCELDTLCGEPTGSCPGEGSCCDPAGNDTPGCSCASCCAGVCAMYPACCDEVWTDRCAVAATLIPACNCDGTTSNDCNTNGIPDDCELAGDFTAEGQVNLADYAVFRGCLTGVVPVTLAPGCCYFDDAPDNDIDLRDFAAFANQFSGP